MSEVAYAATRISLREAFAATEGAAGWLRPLQRGSIHLYLLYILGTLLVLLLWS